MSAENDGRLAPNLISPFTDAQASNAHIVRTVEEGTFSQRTSGQE